MSPAATAAITPCLINEYEMAAGKTAKGKVADAEEKAANATHAGCGDKPGGRIETKPCKKDTKYIRVVENDSDVHDPRLNLDSLRKSLPPEVFVKSLRRSMQWMIWDIFVWSCCLYAGKLVYKNESLMINNGIDFWSGFVADKTGLAIGGFVAFGMKWSLMICLYIVTGFFMWGTFVVGHDCGHGTFSNNTHINFIVGLVNHGAILVPFTPWQRSHRLHHQYHNHLEKDYSFPWSHDPKYDSPHLEWLDRHRFISASLYPFIGYMWYLLAPVKLGGIDSSHYIIGLPGDRLWVNIDKPELARSWFSVFVCIAFIYFYNTYVYSSVGEFMILYFPCWTMFCYFLYTVTFLQHHSEDVKVFDDSTWRYNTAAFETVDRNYGTLINFLHHHISDCHVVHHLFFTKIPHYNLRKATDAMVEWMKREGIDDMYKCVETHDFFLRVFKYMYRFSTRACLVTKTDM